MLHRAVVPISHFEGVLHDPTNNVERFLGEGLVAPAAAAPACVEIKFQAPHAIDAMLLCMLHGMMIPHHRREDLAHWLISTQAAAGGAGLVVVLPDVL
jgi:hypothetical protein